MGAQPMEALEERSRLRLLQTLQRLRHQRGRGQGDSAAPSLKGAVLDDAILIQSQIDKKRITAYRVITMGAAVRIIGMAEVSRMFAVIQDDLLVEITKFIKH